ncbi:hypothetical protein PR003_g21272 [Phytophthora rubi]|uniref:Tyr recombinase domain-containing protein n=1 Tax=Phytophthora rubi TaxID=129364 RepID=A0A6A4DFL0_9STRA|nr:hypothetical protein PR001_g16249 [Phytophthora rubi]KAE9306320.1 hypothetical protein PR003_g21272 [Phytophthora rubi]
MHASGDPVICPVIALRHLKIVQQKPAYKSPYLCGDLTVTMVAKSFKATARSIGFPGANYSTHSLRIGGTTALLSGEASNTAIKLLGRWISNCFEQYPTQAANSTTTLSQRMMGTYERRTNS